MLLLLLLLLRLRVRQTLLITEELPLETIILRLQRHNFASHLLIVHATHIVVLVVGRLKEQVTLVPFYPDSQLPLVCEVWTVILLHLVHIHVSLHDDTFIDGLLNIVAAERFAGQSNRRDVWSLAPQQVCRPTNVPAHMKNISKISTFQHLLDIFTTYSECLICLEKNMHSLIIFYYYKIILF